MYYFEGGKRKIFPHPLYIRSAVFTSNPSILYGGIILPSFVNSLKEMDFSHYRTDMQINLLQ